MSRNQASSGEKTPGRLYYGWVVVAACMLLTAIASSSVNGFGVFFKPLAADFGWSRAATSGAQSLLLIVFCIVATPVGWLADRLGRARVLVSCGILSGMGLFLTSQVTALWQLYLTYSLMAGIGLSAVFPLAGIATASWFVQKRGLALGIVTSGTGLGNFIGAPFIAGLIERIGWSRTYMVLGITVFTIFMMVAFVLRRTPAPGESGPGSTKRLPQPEPDCTSFREALRTRTLWTMAAIFFLFSFCSQLVTVHLVNYATDLGIAALVAATLIGGMGLSSLAGRILMGAASDRIGNFNVLIASAAGVGLGMILLLFARDLWALYVFVIFFGFCHGSEVPQQTALVGKFFGLKVMLVGVVHSGASLGGAVGAWTGGQIFDMTQSYQSAFLIGIAAMSVAFTGTLLLKRPSFTRTRSKSLPAGTA